MHCFTDSRDAERKSGFGASRRPAARARGRRARAAASALLFAALLAALPLGADAARTFPKIELPAAPTLGAAPSTGVVSKPAPRTVAGISVEPGPLWHSTLANGLAASGMTFAPVLVLFTSPDCVWCGRMKSEVFTDKAVREMLSHFTLVELDVTRHQAEADAYRLQGVPTILILSSDGEVRAGASGYVPAARLQAILRGALNPEYLENTDGAYQGLLKSLDAGAVPEDRWPEILQAMDRADRRRDLRSRIMGLSPFPRRELVRLLRHPQLAVRLGALELLEEVNADAAAYDPWCDEAAAANNLTILARLDGWAEGRNVAPESAGGALFSALTGEQVQSYLQDLLSDSRERSLRALRMLQNGGASVIPMLVEYLDAHPELPEGARNRLREAQYSLCLRGRGTVDAPTLVRKLLYGSLDVRLKAIAETQGAGRAALPVLRDFLDSPDAIVREAAIDALAEAAGRGAVPPIKARLAAEKDQDVIYSALVALGKVRGKAAQDILMSYLSSSNEDLLMAALKSLASSKATLLAQDLTPCLKDPRWRVRVAALDAAAEIKLTSLEAAVTECLADADPFVRYSAVQTLTRIAARRSLPKLEELFLKEDDIKAPVAAAYVSMEAPLPSAFGRALKGKSKDVILGVLAAMESCSMKDLALVEPYCGDPDADVAAAAVRLLGMRGLQSGRYRARLKEILRGGQRDTVLTALEAMAAGSSRYSYRQDSGFTIVWDSPSSGPTAEAETGSSAAVDDLLNAFSDAAAPRPSPAPGPTATAEPAPSGAAVEDLLAAFGEDAVPGAPAGGGDSPGEPPAVAKGDCSPRELGDAVLALVDAAADPEVRFRGTLLLASWGNRSAGPRLGPMLDSRTVAERIAVAEAVGKLSGPDVAKLLERLLQDASEEVRAAAADACLAASGASKLADTALSALLSASTRLQPWEVDLDQLGDLREDRRKAQAVRQWALRALRDEDLAEPLQNLALIALGRAGQKSDADVAEGFAGARSPWQRRAACKAVADIDGDAFLKIVEAVRTDMAEQVRLVLPAVFMNEFSRWKDFLDEAHISETYARSIYSPYRSSRRLPPAARDALLQLIRDPVLAVRVEAYFCLLTNRESLDLQGFIETLQGLPDQKGVSSRLLSFMSSNYEELGPGFRILLPYLERSVQRDDDLNRIRSHFKVREDDAAADVEFVTRSGTAVEASYLPAPRAPAAPSAPHLVYFRAAGCPVCEKVERLLDEVKREHPGLTVDVHDIRRLRAMQANEALCERFGVPANRRLVAPAVFAAAGALVNLDITPVALRELLARSESASDPDWAKVTEESLAGADTSIRQRDISFGVVALAGLVDGINPCAIATIIFLLSYLQIARRPPREVAQVGLAFIAGVFGAYFLLGLGLIEAISRIQSVLAGFRKALNWALAGFSLVIMALNVRDGILCLHGRLKDMTLQLPGFLKGRIHGAIQRGSRHGRFVAAAFVTGAVVSIIELACTGQVYLPTIGYMLGKGDHVRAGLGYLTIYNLMFVAPLFAIFLVACFGFTHARLTELLYRHAALVKFCTAALFLFLFLYFVLGAAFDIALPGF